MRDLRAAAERRAGAAGARGTQAADAGEAGGWLEWLGRVVEWLECELEARLT